MPKHKQLSGNVKFESADPAM